MLARANRLVLKRHFALATKRGTKYSNRYFVVYYFKDNSLKFDGPKIGFIVSKKVGNSVVRHKVTRRLRHIFIGNLGEFSGIDLIVVRAFPAIVQAEYQLLTQQLVDYKQKFLGTYSEDN